MRRCPLISFVLMGSLSISAPGFTEASERNFGEDVQFLSEHDDWLDARMTGVYVD